MRVEHISEELDYFVWLIRDELDNHQFPVNKRYIEILSISPLQLRYQTKTFVCEFQLVNYVHEFKLTYL